MRVLLVEDDRMIASSLTRALRDGGDSVDWVGDAESAMSALGSREHGLILLDLGLPGGDGLNVLRSLRAAKDGRPVIIITARDDLSTRIAGLDLGADDYVVKPYSLRVLIQRVHALIRRKGTEDDSDDQKILDCNGVKLDLRRYNAYVDDQRIELTRSEFKLLATLLGNPGRAYERSELIEAALGDDTLVLERTIDVHVRAIRRKLGDRSSVIETVRGVGYRFREI